MDCARAVYLLETLQSRGLTWPMFWWQPDIDGGVCSFLGKVDPDFDAHATLKILEAKEEEQRLQAAAAEINSRIDTKHTRFGRKISEEGLRAMWAAMAKGEATYSPPSADPEGEPAVESSGAEDGRVGGKGWKDGDMESSEGNKKSRRVEAGMEAKEKVDEDTQMKD